MKQIIEGTATETKASAFGFGAEIRSSTEPCKPTITFYWAQQAFEYGKRYRVTIEEIEESDG